MRHKTNFLDDAINSLADKISTRKKEAIRHSTMPPFGKVALTPDEAAEEYLKKPPEARQRFQQEVGTEAMLKIAERIAAKRGRFHA